MELLVFFVIHMIILGIGWQTVPKIKNKWIGIPLLGLLILITPFIDGRKEEPAESTEPYKRTKK